MKAVGVQLDIVWEEKAANFAKVRALVEAVDAAPGSLIVLPEMFATGFSMNVARIRESEARETEAFLAALARGRRAFVIGGVVHADTDGRGRNEALVLDPEGRRVARYCKMHPFSFAGEDRHYASGEGPVTFAWGEFTVAPFICYDLRFPEIFRDAVGRGADCFAVIACWPRPREGHWLTLLQARAIENQACVIGVNRVGSDPKAAYSGRSVIIDPRGRVLADAGSGEGVVAADLDREALAQYRREFPALADMRAEYKRRA